MTFLDCPAWDNLRSERFDPLALWQRVGGDMGLLREVVRIFASESPQMLRSIEDAVQRRDASAIQKTTHNLKGTLLQFAAPAASAAAAHLEQSASRISMEEARLCLNKLRMEIETLMRALRTMTAEISPEFGKAAE
jgi:HPt (histidine-containing phosphotransfer) domain-containing protein